MKYLIAGLGNIGDDYANTRHNIGFIVVDALARLSGVSFQSGRYADVARIRVKNKSLVLIKPTTYMNLSGKAVRYWLEAEKVPLENLLVVVDDIALPPGQLRLRMKGGPGGHNGLINIIETLGTEEFARLRFGIGNDFPKGYQTEYVLGQWTKAEEEPLVPKIEEAVEMIKSFVNSRK
ncbi:MAG: aminoacyl-tRNA hydrolase [Bacteroidales bacterium]|jgi:PTH1 family peptidyl-tRNA hydrolase|nr:aminoacyl-tRNA hydrolase [Bacteroidales bacterium]